MYPPPETDDIHELRQWCEEFHDYMVRLGQQLGGWENIESDAQASPTWQTLIDDMENGLLRRI